MQGRHVIEPALVQQTGRLALFQSGTHPFTVAVAGLLIIQFGQLNIALLALYALPGGFYISESGIQFQINGLPKQECIQFGPLDINSNLVNTGPALKSVKYAPLNPQAYRKRGVPV